jgi:hypothetical protein
MIRPWKIDCWFPLTWEHFHNPTGRLFILFFYFFLNFHFFGFPSPCRVSFILPGQLILLAFLVETNIFEASHVTFFKTN